MIKNLIKQILRLVEKIPGINMFQVILIDDSYYLMTPKVGTRTIRNLVLKEGQPKIYAWKHIQYLTSKQINKAFINKKLIIVTRDPLERLHSCWKQKIQNKNFYKYFWQYPQIKNNSSFIDFMTAISKIKPYKHEKHFRPLSYGLDLDVINHQLISIEDLSELLKKNHSNFTGNKSNTTITIILSEEERDFYQKNLSELYKKDLEINEYAKNKR